MYVLQLAIYVSSFFMSYTPVLLSFNRHNPPSSKDLIEIHTLMQTFWGGGGVLAILHF